MDIGLLTVIARAVNHSSNDVKRLVGNAMSNLANNVELNLQHQKVGFINFEDKSLQVFYHS